MKALLLIALILTATVVRAENDTPFEYFVNGIWYCLESLVYDLTHRSPTPTLDAFKTVPEIILTAGYRYETHKIVTDDNYVNTAWRIVGKLKQSEAQIPPEEKP